MKEVGNTFVLGSVPNLDNWYPDLDEKKFALGKCLKKIVKNFFIKIKKILSYFVINIFVINIVTSKNFVKKIFIKDNFCHEKYLLKDFFYESFCYKKL